jgi:membrane protease YdiL (CAAX protease family)
MLGVFLACLPVTVVVLRRIARWRHSGRGLPLPQGGAMRAVRWPTWYGIALSAMLWLLLQLTASLYAYASDAGWLPWEPLDVPDMLSPGIFLSQAVPLLVGLALVARFGRGALGSVGWHLDRAGRAAKAGLIAVGAALPVCLVVLVLSHYVLRLVGGPVRQHPVLTTLQESPTAWVMAGAAVQAVVLAPLMEELVYRGILQPTLVKGIGAGRALVLASAVFALAHGSLEPQGLPALFVLGLALGYASYRTRSLVAPIVAHAAFNGVMLVGVMLQ